MKVIGKVVEKGKRTMYKVQFVDTGYETLTQKGNIVRGTVMDRYFKSIYGVGFIGNAKKADNPRAYKIWNGMITRCYNPNADAHKDYGAKGVSVASRWHCFEFFLADLEHIEGYDEELFNSARLQLDKDIKQVDKLPSEKIYSLETCIFVSPEENMAQKIKDNSVDFIAISPDDDIYNQTLTSVKSFAEEHGLEYKVVNKILKGEAKTYRGWVFGYADEAIEDIKKKRIHKQRADLIAYVAVSPDDEVFEGVGLQAFISEHNLNRGNVQACMKGTRNHHKGWVFGEQGCDIEKLKEKRHAKKKPSNLSKFTAIAPNGDEFVAENAREFAREHGLDYKHISACLNGKAKTHLGWKFEKNRDA